MAAVDWEAEGLLEGLDGEARESRCRLLEELYDDGVALEELRQAVAENRLVLLPVERVLSPDGENRYTAEEVAERAQLDLDVLLGNWQALGLPVPGDGDRVFDEVDVEAARRRKTILDSGLPEDGLLEMARLLGNAMAQIAGGVRWLVGDAYIQEGGSERDLAVRYAEAARVLHPLMGSLLAYAFNLHLREGLRQDVVSQSELEAGRLLPGSEVVAVCFADLVGFTRLGEQVPPEELGAVARRLATLAAETAEPPVRLVKTIGDAAMLVSPEPDPLLGAALAMVERAEEEGEGFPQLRVGAACGNALQRAGDWYGPPVNIASRVTAVARPGAVLATGELRGWAEGDYNWSRAGRRKLKGVRQEVSLHRLRRGNKDA